MDSQLSRWHRAVAPTSRHRHAKEDSRDRPPRGGGDRQPVGNHRQHRLARAQGQDLTVASASDRHDLHRQGPVQAEPDAEPRQLLAAQRSCRRHGGRVARREPDDEEGRARCRADRHEMGDAPDQVATHPRPVTQPGSGPHPSDIARQRAVEGSSPLATRSRAWPRRALDHGRPASRRAGSPARAGSRNRARAAPSSRARPRPRGPRGPPEPPSRRAPARTTRGPSPRRRRPP